MYKDLQPLAQQKDISEFLYSTPLKALSFHKYFENNDTRLEFSEDILRGESSIYQQIDEEYFDENTLELINEPTNEVQQKIDYQINQQRFQLFNHESQGYFTNHSKMFECMDYDQSQKQPQDEIQCFKEKQIENDFSLSSSSPRQGSQYQDNISQNNQESNSEDNLGNHSGSNTEDSSGNHQGSNLRNHSENNRLKQKGSHQQSSKLNEDEIQIIETLKKRHTINNFDKLFQQSGTLREILSDYFMGTFPWRQIQLSKIRVKKTKYIYKPVFKILVRGFVIQELKNISPNVVDQPRYCRVHQA